MEASEKPSTLADLNLGDCDLSISGVTQLLDVLSNLKNPLHSLSIAHNKLGRLVWHCTGINIKFVVEAVFQ